MKKTITLIWACFAYMFTFAQSPSDTLFVKGTDTLTVFAGDTLAVFGALVNEGTIDIKTGAAILFFGESWKNSNSARILGDGKVIFSNQSKLQQIDGGIYASSFPSVVLNNPFGVELINSNAAIRDTLQFIKGYITLNNNNLALGTLARNATLLGYDQNHFIITNGANTDTRGFVMQMTPTNDELMFPIGNKKTSYLPLTLTRQNTQTDSVSLRVFDNMYANAVNGNLQNDISVGKTWQLQSALAGNRFLMKIQHNIDNEGNKYNKNYQYITDYQNAKWNKAAFAAMGANTNPGNLTSGAPIPTAYIASTMMDNLSQNVYFTKVTYQNGKPLAGDDINIFYQNTTATGNVLTNDIDLDGHPLTASITPIFTPRHGALTLNSDGSYTYTPAANYLGKDMFVYEVCDNGVPSRCDTAVVSLCIALPPANSKPLAIDDNLIAPYSTDTYDIAILGNDIAAINDSLGIPTLILPTNIQGTITLTPDGILHYTAPATFVAYEQIQYYIQSHGAIPSYDTATVTIQLYESINENSPPTAIDDVISATENTTANGNVAINDFDVDAGQTLTFSIGTIAAMHGTVVINPNGTYNYTPNTGFLGADNFTYMVCDDGNPQECVEATVYVLVEKGTPTCIKAKICAPVTIRRRVK
jgi:hypothetical protein